VFSAPGQQKSDSVEPIRTDRTHERCLAEGIRRVHVRPFVDEQADRFQVSHFGRKQKCVIATSTLRLRVCASREHPSHEVRGPIAVRSRHQRSAPLLRLRVDVGSMLARDQQALQRFQREARAASALNHPGIVTVSDTGSEDGLAYLVTEFVDGATLRQSRPETMRWQLDIAAQVAEALAVAHAAGITHRDLKPENIMVTRDGRAKILDFGLAIQAPTALREETLTVLNTVPGTVLGTVGYMSPEEARGRAADHRSDIFSLGAVMYELFSGQRAFTGETPADTLSAILKNDPADLPASVPAGFGRSSCIAWRKILQGAFSQRTIWRCRCEHWRAPESLRWKRSPRPPYASGDGVGG
jgi:serine/threonine protein kinase